MVLRSSAGHMVIIWWGTFTQVLQNYWEIKMGVCLLQFEDLIEHKALMFDRHFIRPVEGFALLITHVRPSIRRCAAWAI